MKKDDIRVTQIDLYEPDIETSVYLKWALDGYDVEVVGPADFDLDRISRDDIEKYGLLFLKLVKIIDDGVIYSNKPTPTPTKESPLNNKTGDK